MAEPPQEQPKGPIPIAPGTRPPAPPGMVAVPAAALSGRQQHAAQMAGANIGVIGGLAGGGGADIVTGAVVGGWIGQQVGRYERAAVMSDPNAPMVFVDENSRAGRRAIRRQKRRQRRMGGGGSPSAEKKNQSWFKSLFGSGNKDDGDRSASESEDGDGRTEKQANK